MLGLIVPPANGSPCRGNENQPIGRRPVISAEDLGRAHDPLALVLARQPADILVLEAMGGDLVALGEKGADPVGVNFREHCRHREGCLQVVSPQ